MLESLFYSFIKYPISVNSVKCGFLPNNPPVQEGSLHKPAALENKTVNLTKHKSGLSIQVVTNTNCTVLGHLHCVRQSWHGFFKSGY